ELLAPLRDLGALRKGTRPPVQDGRHANVAAIEPVDGPIHLCLEVDGRLHAMFRDHTSPGGHSTRRIAASSASQVSTTRSSATNPEARRSLSSWTTRRAPSVVST